VELSLILMASTMFPAINVARLFTYMSIGLAAALAVGGIYVLRTRPGAAVEVEQVAKDKRSSWTMPPLALLERPAWSPGRKAAMLMLRGYLVVAVLLLVIKTVQLGH
jgi:hypothetical protein